MRRLVVFALAVAALPSVEAALSDRLVDLTFPEVRVEVSDDKIRVIADRGTVAGTSASDLRKCIDGADCPDATLEEAGQGDGDGLAETNEIRSFERNLLIGLNVLGGNVSALREDLRTLATIDGKAAERPSFEELHFEGAEGGVAITTAIQVTLQVLIPFPNVGDGDEHQVRLQRTESDLELAQRIVVRGGSGWSIKGDSIEPTTMRGYFVDGSITGTQDQFEDPQPLVFTIEKDEGSTLGTWLLLLAVLLIAGGVTAFLLARRKRRQA